MNSERTTGFIGGGSRADGALMALPDEDGYEVWLRYPMIEDPKVLHECRQRFRSVVRLGDSPVLLSAEEEFVRAFTGMLGEGLERGESLADGVIVLGDRPSLAQKGWGSCIGSEELAEEGFVLKSVVLDGKKATLVVGGADRGALYGAFHLIRLLQTRRLEEDLHVLQNPRIDWRIAYQWDNPVVRTVERGHAGLSIFDWESMPKMDPRYEDYARILASVGINGIVLNNVNTLTHGGVGWRLITTEFLHKMVPLAQAFRSYGIRIFITANFGSPILTKELGAADPLGPAVEKWWSEKADEIYRLIPDFGGLAFKADSEGETGPKGYDRTPVEGARPIAEALARHGGVVFWRTFGYSYDDSDRAGQPLNTFGPFDGLFAENVILQTKNGPIDYQPREPISPIFGAMPATNQSIEVQVTQEYTGFSTHVCYLAPLWKEAFAFDTFADGPGSTVVSELRSKKGKLRLNGISGVMNVGDDRNWTGHHLAQANTYAFGRLAWDPELSSEEIADEWTKMTFGHDPKVVATIVDILLRSRETYEKYTTPMGTAFFCGYYHYDPDPQFYPYLHHCDATGVGYDRTMATGSGFTSQYQEEVRNLYENLETCPEEIVFFFHHLAYDHKLKSGKTVMQVLYDSYYEGVEEAKSFIDRWEKLEGRIDRRRFEHVLERLREQYEHAVVWRHGMLRFFWRMSGFVSDEKGRFLISRPGSPFAVRKYDSWSP